MRKGKKRLEEKLFHYLSAAITLFIVFLLLHIIWSIASKGFAALSWQMITDEPKGGFYFGKEGGILNAIAGSFYLAIPATLLSFGISLPVALFINVYLRKHPRWANGIRFSLDVLWGVPSIVYGAFAFTIMMFAGVKTSLIAGIITVAVMIAPIMIRAMDEVLKTIPIGLHEAAYALGATKTETSFHIFFRKALPAFATAILLAFGRGVGDAASVLFTTGFTDYVPSSLQEPAATLPLAIFFQLGSPVKEVQSRAYAAALLLTIIILIVSVLTRLLNRNAKRL